jgi:hypothetical protein
LCTVLISVRPDDPWPVLLLATRDESRDRAWDPPARWWESDYPHVVGGRDRQAGGSWFSLDVRRRQVAVVLNRVESLGAQAARWSAGGSRGSLVLRAAGDAAELSESDVHGLAPFNLVTATSVSATWYRWDGASLHSRTLSPGTHVVSTRDLDDPTDQRVATWLPRARSVSRPDPDVETSPDLLWRPWTGLLEQSSRSTPPDSDVALTIEKRVGARTIATLSLSAAALGQSRALLDFAELPRYDSSPRLRRITSWSAV